MHTIWLRVGSIGSLNRRPVPKGPSPGKWSVFLTLSEHRTNQLWRCDKCESLDIDGGVRERPDAWTTADIPSVQCVKFGRRFPSLPMKDSVATL